MSNLKTEVKPSSEGNPATLFVRQSIAEVRKIVWPTASELNRYFWTVMAFLAIMITFLIGLDFSFNWMVSSLAK